MAADVLTERVCRCHYKGCDHPAEANLARFRFCRQHTLSICRERLKAAADLLEGDNLRAADVDSARKFVIECADAVTELARDGATQGFPDQAKVMEIMFWVEDLSQKLKRFRQQAP